MLTVNRNPSVSQVRTFGLTTLGGFVVIGALLWIYGRSSEMGWGWSGSGGQVVAVACWLAGLAFAGVCTTWRGSGRTLYVVWMTAASWLGTIVTFIMLSLVFFLLLPPFALIRLGDPLRTRARRVDTYWEDHKPQEPTLQRMMRLF